MRTRSDDVSREANVIVLRRPGDNRPATVEPSENPRRTARMCRIPGEPGCVIVTLDRSWARSNLICTHADTGAAPEPASQTLVASPSNAFAGRFWTGPPNGPVAFEAVIERAPG